MSALSLAQLVSWGALTYSFSLLIVPMEAELGWSRASLSGALSLGLLVAGLLSYPVGTWIDRRGGRWLMSAGSALGALLLAAWSQVESLPVFYLIWVGLGAATAASLYEPVFAVLTRLFPASFRTKITAITLVGGFASTLFIPLTQWLIAGWGWRGALMWLAGTVAVLCLPVHLCALACERPGPGEVHAAPEPGQVRRALRTRPFWGLLACFTAYYGTFSAMTYHMVPMLTEQGVAPGLAVLALALIGPSQVAGRAGLLLLANRPRTRVLGPLVTGLYTVAVLPLALHLPGEWA
ncbi:MAG: MFS transporter, partial [Magnetospirillum sp.]|nr:MFS transporter [Magnetospirillum sp.]